MIAQMLIPVFSSNEFDWTGYHGYANASKMPAEIGITDPFAVRSERTGKIRLFIFAEAVYMDEHEDNPAPAGWIFDAEPGKDFLSITIWNDLELLDTNNLGNF